MRSHDGKRGERDHRAPQLGLLGDSQFCVARRLLAFALLSLSLSPLALMGCDHLPMSKPKSNIELIVAKTSPGEGLNPRWTADIRIHNHGDAVCRLLSYELTWRNGSKVVRSEHTETILPNAYVLKTVHLRQSGNDKQLEGLSGEANCVVD